MHSQQSTAVAMCRPSLITFTQDESFGPAVQKALEEALSCKDDRKSGMSRFASVRLAASPPREAKAEGVLEHVWRAQKSGLPLGLAVPCSFPGSEAWRPRSSSRCRGGFACRDPQISSAFRSSLECRNGKDWEIAEQQRQESRMALQHDP